jgi:hypothetical protein
MISSHTRTQVKVDGVDLRHKYAAMVSPGKSHVFDVLEQIVTVKVRK